VQNLEDTSVHSASSGVATGWTGVDMSSFLSTTLLLEVAPKIDTNPTNFYRGRGGAGSLRLQTPVIGSRSALAMSVHLMSVWRRPWVPKA